MNRPNEPIFTTRPTVTLELPLGKHTRILHAEQIILKIADRFYDIGALCYALRSEKPRKSRQPREVATSSLHKHRTKQILQLIKALSNLIISGGKSLITTGAYAWNIINFLDWADGNDLHDCVSGGDATRNAFHAWATYTRERYQRQEFDEANHNLRLTLVCELLEATTGLENLMQGFRKVTRKKNPNSGTEPLALHDFAHAVALNQALFDGLCDVVLDNRSFPYKLELPSSLKWEKNHLWIFPTKIWRLPPHLRDDAIRANKGSNACWAYDYENGRLAIVDEIEHRYKGRIRWERRHSARDSIKRATAKLDEVNTDSQHAWRYMLGMVAQRAFLFLFFCNTGGNAQVVRELETDGTTIDAPVKNQKYRSLKWRASGKAVELNAPATFMPRLRRFMELRQYLLQGRKTPYLFFTTGNHNNIPPKQIGDWTLENHYIQLLLEIDPQLPRMGSKALRASVEDYYQCHHESVVAAAVMGHTPETGLKNYGRGSANEHHHQMTLFLTSVSESARRQRVISIKDAMSDTPPLEGGGSCEAFGHPEALAAHAPVQPNCKDSQGCLFCKHRVLVAGEDDARKVASTAYVMEQLILGPKHEDALRPLICKCDEDLEKIAAFPNCRTMVEKVRKDVYDKENLTPFWADKYQLFLELGIIS